MIYEFNGREIPFRQAVGVFALEAVLMEDKEIIEACREFFRLHESGEYSAEFAEKVDQATYGKLKLCESTADWTPDDNFGGLYKKD